MGSESEVRRRFVAVSTELRASGGVALDRRPREATLRIAAIAGGAWSPAVAATGRTVGGWRSLSEGRAGKQRDQRESCDKGFHDASPFVRTIARGFLQQRQAHGPGSSVIGEIAPSRRSDELYFGFGSLTKRSTRSYFGLGHTPVK